MLNPQKEYRGPVAKVVRDGKELDVTEKEMRDGDKIAKLYNQELLVRLAPNPQ